MSPSSDHAQGCFNHIMSLPVVIFAALDSTLAILTCYCGGPTNADLEQTSIDLSLAKLLVQDTRHQAGQLTVVELSSLA